MRYRLNKHIVLSGIPEGPLATHLRALAGWLSQQGYTARYVHRHVMLAAHFSRWLKRRRVLGRCVNSEHPSQYLRCRHRRRRVVSGDVPSLRNLMTFLRERRVIPAEKTSTPRLTAAERCARAYEQYLRQDRALAKATIINYVPFIRAFLQHRFDDRAVRLSCLRAADVVRFVQCHARRLHVKRAKLMTTALRSFFQYARLHGKIALDLAAAVPIVASWSMASIPRAIAPEQTRKLLASIDRKSAIGRRDYAILLMLARLGVRAGEVVSLELHDIDWSAGELTVRGRRGRRIQMPLPPDVGRAIAAYLRHGRPQCTSRRVFLRTKAPIGGFHGTCGVGSIVRHRLKRARIASPTFGAHQFRHGLASDMLRQGASLAEIGAVLGHQHPDTTRIYTKIDLKALHTLAQRWPGGMP
jgi:integrase/recombinase XerD